MNQEVNTFRRKFENGTWFRVHRKIFDLSIPNKQRRFVYSVYLALASYANADTDECYPSEATIAKITGISLRKVVEIIQLISSLRMIVIRQTKVGIKKRNRYLLTDTHYWLSKPPSADATRNDMQVVHMNEIKSDNFKYSNARDALIAKMAKPMQPP